MFFSWAKYISGFKEIIRDIYIRTSRQIILYKIIYSSRIWRESTYIQEKQRTRETEPKDKRIVENFIVY